MRESCPYVSAFWIASPGSLVWTWTLDNIIVRHAYDGIADRFQISLELCLVFIRKRLVRHNDKFCTIAEFDISFGLLSRFYHL